MQRHNCPNCGAPIEDVKCPYCGTILYDFAALDADHPTYVRIKVGEDVLTFNARLAHASVCMDPCDITMSVSLELDGIPDKNGAYFVEQRKIGDHK